MITERDITIQKFGSEYLVMAADNSGAIGNLPHDEVKVPYDIISAFGARVCLMEILASGAEPFSFIIHSFNGEKAWDELLQGAERTFSEAGLKNIEITGSTESNMSMLQSASSFTLLARAREEELRIHRTPQEARFAVIGVPLVGSEVVSRREEVLPLSLFTALLKMEGIHEILPVGSKGIAAEVALLAGASRQFTCELKLNKSAGPSTCAIISYRSDQQAEIQQRCGKHFHPLLETNPLF